MYYIYRGLKSNVPTYNYIPILFSKWGTLSESTAESSCLCDIFEQNSFCVRPIILPSFFPKMRSVWHKLSDWQICERRRKTVISILSPRSCVYVTLLLCPKHEEIFLDPKTRSGHMASFLNATLSFGGKSGCKSS